MFWIINYLYRACTACTFQIRPSKGIKTKRHANVQEEIIEWVRKTAAELHFQISNQPAFNRNRLKAEKLINSNVLEQLVRVQADAGCSRATA